MPDYLVCLVCSALVCLSLLAPVSLLGGKARVSLVVFLALLLLLYGLITFAGMAALSIMAATLYMAGRDNLRGWLTVLSALVATILVFALSMNLLPGFVKVAIEAPPYLGNATQPFAMNIGFAKAMVGILLLLFWVKPETELRHLGQKMLRALPFIIAFPVVILLFASALGWAFDPKWYAFSPVFILANFCLSTVAEEAFFRAALQYRFQQFLAAHTAYAGFISLIGVSLFFGSLHLGGGATYALLATLAGLAYGWIYWRFHSLHAAIVCHLLLNSLHFVFLLYPR